MAADGFIRIDTKINASGVNQGVKEVQSGLNKLTGSIAKVGTALGFVQAAKQLKELGAQCIDVASDLAEVQNVVDTAFGAMSGSVDKWAKGAIKQFGMSELAAKQTASTYMSMAKAMGAAENDAADMSLTLAGLSADVASFYNLDQETAAYKLRSVFTGETEALKDLGIVMTQANLEAYAMANGYDRAYSSMSASEQLAVRYGYVMESLSLAQGDFARTSDGWANQMRVFNEQLASLKAIVGEVLMNWLLPALQKINDALGWLVGKATEAKNALFELFGWETSDTSSGSVSGAVDDLAGSYDDLADSAGNAADAIEDANSAAGSGGANGKKQVLGFDEITKLNDTSSGGSGGGSGGAGGGGSTGATASDAAQQTRPLVDGANALADAVNDLSFDIDDLADKARNALQPISDLFRNHTATTRLKLEKDKSFDDLKAQWDSLKAEVIVKRMKTLLEMEVRQKVEQLLTVQYELDPSAAPIQLQCGCESSIPARPDDYTAWDFFADSLDWGGLVNAIDNWRQTIEDQRDWDAQYGRDGGNFGSNGGGNGGSFTASSSFGGNGGSLSSSKKAQSFLKTVQNWWKSLGNGTFTKKLTFEAGGGSSKKTVKEWNSVQDEDVTKTVKGYQSTTYKTVQSAWKSWTNGTVTKTAGAQKSSLYKSVRSDWTSWKDGTVMKTVNGYRTNDFKTAQEQYADLKDKKVKATLNMVATVSSVRDFINSKILTPLNRSLVKVNPDWKIPYLATGGVVNRATMAMVGEAGREAVLPLDRNTGWMDELALRLASTIGSAQITGGGELVVEINIGSERITRQVVGEINRLTRQSGRCPIHI